MAIEELPFLDRLTNDISWNDQEQVLEMRFANTSAKATVGRNPFVSTVSMTWAMQPHQKAAWVAAVKQPLKRFKYYSDVHQRWVVLRPTGQATYEDTGLMSMCSISFERVK